jgi:hypothetical protein
LQDGLSNWNFHPRNFGSVLHCVEIGGAYHFALNAEQGAFLYTPPKDAIDRAAGCCRAAKKLEELFTALGMLEQQFGLAIDIGEFAFNTLTLGLNDCLFTASKYVFTIETFWGLSAGSGVWLKV